VTEPRSDVPVAGGAGAGGAGAGGAGAGGAGAGGDPSSGLRFDGVTLIYRPTDGPPTVEVVSLVVDDHGVTLLGPLPGARRRLSWASLTAGSCGAQEAAPDGRVTTPFELTSPNWTVRLLLDRHPGEPGQTDQLRLRLPVWLGSPSAQPGSAAPGGTLRPRPVPSLDDVLPALTMPLVRAPSVALPPPPAGRPPPALAPGRAAPGGYGYRPFAPPGPTMGYSGLDYSVAASPPKRRRRTLVLVVALLLMASGVTLGLVLGSQPRHTTAASPFITPITPDQHLAATVMLTQGDLPSGWQVAPDTGNSNSSSDQQAQAAISQQFVQCMGITADQGATALGGAASDQTAQTASPVFADSGTSRGSGTALELQSAAAVVKTHQDELQDFTLFTSPKFPQCDATAAAAQLQLGVNDLTGSAAAPGPAAGKVIGLTTFGAEQVLGVSMTFTITEGSGTIPVAVTQLQLGADRIEAQLVTFAIGAPFPSDVLFSSIATLEHRLVAAVPTTTV
jgi:hypothetical protein